MRKILITTLFLFASAAFAADCNSPIVDNANVLGNRKFDVNAAIIALSAKGADPKVITDDPNITPEQYVEAARRECPSWQSANGGVKNNLIVFLVFPKHHKVGLFVGDEFGKALNTSAIRSQFMAPAFKDGDWARGMMSGINEAGVQIEAFQTSALHPATTVVHQEATNFSGLWRWLDAVLLLIALIAAWGLFVYYRKKGQEARDAQQRAVQARNSAAEYVNAHPDTNAAESFSRLSNSETFNPETNGLTVEQYDSIASQYNTLIKKLTNEVQSKYTAAGVNSSSQRRTKSNHHSQRTDIPAASPAPTSAPPSTGSPAPSQVVEHHTTTIINEGYQSPYYQPIVPIIVEEPVYREPYRAPDPEPSYSRPSSGWSDSSSSSDFGSSSSWSDSSSSSSFDSGSSSSDFGGGSSDF